MHQLVPGHVVPVPRKRGPLERLATWPYACACGASLVQLTHRGRFLQCPRCNILYHKHPNAGIEPVWVAKDNSTTLLSDIDTSHLQNIVGYMFLRSDWRENYRQIMLGELERRLEEEKADGPST